MKFENYLQEGEAVKIQPNSIRAKSLIIASAEAIETAKSIKFEENKFKSIIRELYEGLRQFCEAIGYIKGYKFNSHDVITLFLSEILNEVSMANKFDRYRKIRNGINYYGDAVSRETIEEALKEIPTLIKSLSKYVKI